MGRVKGRGNLCNQVVALNDSSMIEFNVKDFSEEHKTAIDIRIHKLY